MTVNALLETVEGEIAFFRSVMRARPVGIHRHFHVLAIRNAILKDTGQIVSTDDIWAKLRSCYDLDALEGLVGDVIYQHRTTELTRMTGNGRLRLALQQHPAFRKLASTISKSLNPPILPRRIRPALRRDVRGPRVIPPHACHRITPFFLAIPHTSTTR
jgi:hypothetical protein